MQVLCMFGSTLCNCPLQGSSHIHYMRLGRWFCFNFYGLMKFWPYMLKHPTYTHPGLIVDLYISLEILTTLLHKI